jgi:glycosyltransferase involved in cell wall biosynthesis
MNLAFYYHIPITKDSSGQLTIPSYLGVFIDSLASFVNHLYLVMHESDNYNAEADYTLKSENITWVNLGRKTPAWHRSLYHKKILKKKLAEVVNCDVMLVRSPSPLAPYFAKYLNKPRLIFMIVGDYSDSVSNMKATTLRQKLIKFYLTYNHQLFEQAIEQTDVVVNSSQLYDQYKTKAKSIHQIRTTTLSTSDFYVKENLVLSSPINLVYTGRIDPQKGLFELVEATSMLNKEGYDVVCNMVGWEPDMDEPVKKALVAHAKAQDIEHKVIFHGKKKVGEELNAMYRMGDMYVIPSYHEGFPRTIWEAMANSLPVIATTVGSIPGFLKHQEDALLIEPKNVQAICDAVVTLMNNKELRERMITRGQLLAQVNTLENQSQKLVEILENVVLG